MMGEARMEPEPFVTPPGKFSVEWTGTGRKAQVPPNPNLPEGLIVVLAAGKVPVCGLDLPYPAPEVGRFSIQCRICGIKVALTAAGRADDPRVVIVACKDLTVT